MPAPSRRGPDAPWFAWLGGALFAGSLAYFAYAYFVRMGRPAACADGDVLGPVLANVALFSLFALHHSLLARTGVKARLTAHISARHERSLYVWVASVLFVLVCAAWQDLPGRVYVQTGPAVTLHVLAVAAGVWLTARSAALLDPLELAGVRQAGGDLGTPEFKVEGPYRRVRHPIYLGWLLMTFGVPDMTWTRAIFAIVSAIYLAAAIPFEERELTRVFGDRYRRYQQTVRSRLLPGLW